MGPGHCKVVEDECMNSKAHSLTTYNIKIYARRGSFPTRAADMALLSNRSVPTSLKIWIEHRQRRIRAIV